VRITFLTEAEILATACGRCSFALGHVHPRIHANSFCQRANILKEVQIMRTLDHPNIVKLVDFFESRQFYFIILELAPGGELFHQIVRLTYFSENLSRHVITQVAQALHYLHEEKGVVHRYVKSNANYFPSLTSL
jgi:serine/threonine protein kinase